MKRETYLLTSVCLLIFMGVASCPVTAQTRTRVYVANLNSSIVSVIDPTTNTVIMTIPVGAAPRGVAITPDGTRVYVSGFRNVTVVETATNSVVRTILVVDIAYGIAITPNGSRAYVTSFSNH